MLASFVVAKDDGSVGDNWSYKTCKVKLQSNRYHHQTYTQFFTGQMPFLSPNQQCQSSTPLLLLVYLLFNQSVFQEITPG